MIKGEILTKRELINLLEASGADDDMPIFISTWEDLKPVRYVRTEEWKPDEFDGKRTTLLILSNYDD